MTSINKIGEKMSEEDQIDDEDLGWGDYEDDE
jgi:hypothetical protein